MNSKIPINGWSQKYGIHLKKYFIFIKEFIHNLKRNINILLSTLYLLLSSARHSFKKVQAMVVSN